MLPGHGKQSPGHTHTHTQIKIILQRDHSPSFFLSVLFPVSFILSLILICFSLSLSLSLSVRSYSSSPARVVLMTSSSEDDHPEEGHDETEDGDKHHPAQRVRWVHMGRSHQDPYQTTKDLQRWRQGPDRRYYGFEVQDICLCQSFLKLTLMEYSSDLVLHECLNQISWQSIQQLSIFHSKSQVGTSWWHQMKSQGITKVSKLYSLSTMNVTLLTWLKAEHHKIYIKEGYYCGLSIRYIESTKIENFRLFFHV